MSSLQMLLRRIAAAPRGPEVTAFFDFDGTLIDGFSGVSIFRDRLVRRDLGAAELVAVVGAAVEMQLRGTPVDSLMTSTIRGLAGRRHEDVMADGYRIFRSEIASRIYPQAREIVRAHRDAGHRLVMATSATPYQARPVCEDLEFDALLATIPAVDEHGRLTGELDNPSLWGPRKAAAIEEYAEHEGLDLDRCFGYSNGGEDTPMLDAVGIPTAVNPDRVLAAAAAANSWPVVYLRKPMRSSDPVSFVRSAAALGAVLASATVGAGVSLVTANRRAGANLTSAMGSQLALALAGIELEVIGQQHVWAQRPAVFLFNHQSSLDAILIAAVVRDDVTAVAKKELSRDPRFLVLGQLFDVAYVDRGNSAAARAALQPAIDKLHSGISVAIAPEGTRMPTRRLGKFKKGAFHLAMEAGVPVVPVVIHNSGEVMWKSSFTAHPGKVTVTVSEPIPTSGWNRDRLDEHIAHVRSVFDRILGND